MVVGYRFGAAFKIAVQAGQKNYNSFSIFVYPLGMAFNNFSSFRLPHGQNEATWSFALVLYMLVQFKSICLFTELCRNSQDFFGMDSLRSAILVVCRVMAAIIFLMLALNLGKYRANGYQPPHLQPVLVIGLD